MANKEHLKVLLRGAAEWNAWVVKHPEVKPNLSNAGLGLADISYANLRYADFSNAKLPRAYLGCADLSRTNFTYSNLSEADLSRADLSRADLRGANLSRANLFSAQLRTADLRGADLRGANLSCANLSDVDLRGANITGAHVSYAIFADIDLREVIGLENVWHSGPSEISFSTIYRSEGRIPEVFLRGAGLPESLIVQIPALVVATQPIQFYSCFISYSSKDQAFAERLHADLQARGVRVWFAPHDMKIGARIRPTIDEFIRVHDKLLLVLSENSVSSQWVEQEVETALRKERRPGGGTVLFPVRLDDLVLVIDEGWPALIKDTRHVGDFTRWKDHDSYSAAFERLIRDLQAEA